MLELRFWTSIDLIASIHYKKIMSSSLAIALTFVPISLEAKFGEFIMPHNEWRLFVMNIVIHLGWAK